MKIQLVNPRAVIGINYGDGVYWPNGLLSIGSYIKQKHPEINVEILDEPLIGSQKDLEDRLDGDIIGITSNALNYGNVLKTAEKARKKKGKVVIGGFHATALGEIILKNRAFVDVVIKRDGEKAFLSYIENKPFKDINNLVYRDKNKIITNPINVENISLSIDLDYNLLDLEKYFQNHKKNFPDAPERTAVFFTHMGCKWREKTKGCSFCSIFHKHQRLEPKELWNKIEKLKEKYNIQGIKDYGDDFISDKEWIKELIRTRPKNLKDIIFSGIYASPRYMTEEIADFLQQLNITYVYLGFESGNNRILKLANKGETIEHNYKIAQMLDKRNIKILASYVLGLERESEKTLKHTYEFGEKIANLKSTKLSQAGFIVPFPGSELYKKLSLKLEEYKQKDSFDAEKTRKDWIKYFCNFNSDIEDAYKLIEQTSKKMIKLSPLQTNYLGINP